MKTGNHKCPHCGVVGHFKATATFLQRARNSTHGWSSESAICPACDEIVIGLLCGHSMNTSNGWTIVREELSIEIFPASSNRFCPSEVPPDIARDFREAVSISGLSPQASAALGRRCLQQILREQGGVKPSSLGKEIDEASPKLPSDIAGQLHSLRQIGNFAAHPMKDTATGEIIPVEEGEADWTLDIVSELFEYYYVRPAKIAAKKAELNKKLTAAGKPNVA